MLDQPSKDATQDSNKHSLIFGNVYVFDIGSIYIHGKRITQKTYTSIKNTGNNLTMKQMLDVSEKLIVGQSDEIYGVTPINWEDSSWKQLSLVSDEESHQSLAREGLRIFRFCVMPWKDAPEPNNQILSGKTS